MTLNTTAKSVDSSLNDSTVSNSDNFTNASSQLIGNKRKRRQKDLVNHSADDSSSSLNTTLSSDNSAKSAPDSHDFVIASDDAKAIPINRSKQRVALDKDKSSQSLTSQGAAIARWLNAECLTSSTRNLSRSHGQDALRFTCQKGHNFFLGLQDVSKLHELLAKHCPNTASGQACSDSCMHVLSPNVIESITWCSKCSKIFNLAKQAASRIDLKVTGGLYSDLIHICCNKANHKFTISYQKKLQFLSCLQCSHDEREEQKQRRHDDETRHDELCRQMQDKLFAQARMHMQTEMRSTNNNLNSPNCTCGKCNRCCRSNSSSQYWNPSFDQSQVQQVSLAEYYASLEQAINLRASYQAKAYLQDTQATQMTYEQCFLVYKFGQTPTDALVSGMKTLASRSAQIDLKPANTYYRNLARQLHPDKNCHPMAKDAFQRVTDSFELFKKQMQFDQHQGSYAYPASSFAQQPDPRFNNVF